MAIQVNLLMLSVYDLGKSFSSGHKKTSISDGDRGQQIQKHINGVGQARAHPPRWFSNQNVEAGSGPHIHPILHPFESDGIRSVFTDSRGLRTFMWKSNIG